MGDARGGGAGGALPWAQLLDPVANARALGEVQARGLQAAGELVERVIAAADDRAGRAPVDPGPLDEADQATSPAGQVLEAWIGVLRRTVEALGERGTLRPIVGGDPRSVEVEVATGRTAGHLRVDLDALGATASTPEVWLHNGTGHPVTGIVLRCSTPLSPDGTALAGTIAFDPACVDELPARSSRGIVVTVCADGPLAPGTYRSLVQATGAPEVWLPLEVVVQEPDP